MSRQPIYLVVGVSGSGKSWACRQVTEKFHYIPHDRCWTHPDHPGSWNAATPWAADMKDESRYIKGAESNHLEVLLEAVNIAQRPVLTECPFAERQLREDLEANGAQVIPVFVIEDPVVVAERYERREGKPVSSAVLTRANSIKKRAEEWNAFSGKSDEVLSYLRSV